MHVPMAFRKVEEFQPGSLCRTTAEHIFQKMLRSQPQGAEKPRKMGEINQVEQLLVERGSGAENFCFSLNGADDDLRLRSVCLKWWSASMGTGGRLHHGAVRLQCWFTQLALGTEEEVQEA